MILFEFVGDPQILEVHVFRTTHYSGIMIETDGERISLIHVQWNYSVQDTSEG